ncbi:conserved hypothetical protein [Methanococcus vannielii SB]|uniref:DUF2341 domain-containing protein n=1 Tax=Methanococcus vannielii (strain ATCC 35089 / DSM 1224 / JCM 13029 / OCM 148 / SB) TaxID=406327 RepID=A6URM9_METVS|nr:DUF2341 domain-containing protein [Methanococcus vannielii]ABR55151.1 conserved hypothetical protein [Methanococcus vannielii SB]
MYLSQSTTTLVLILMLTATLTYHTLDLQRNQVLTEMEASSIDLKSSSLEHVIETSIPVIFNKALNDAQLENIGRYNGGNSNPFFSTPEDVLFYLKNETEKTIVKNYIENVTSEYSKSGYNVTYNFNITNISMVDGFTFKINYDFYYKIDRNDGNVFKEQNISSFKYSTAKTVLDSYQYIKPTYVGIINVSNPNNQILNDFQVKVVFNSTNFNYAVEPTGEGLRFFDSNGNYVPYWVELWDYNVTTNKERISILWLKVPEMPQNTNTSIYIVSTYPKISESNGNLVFEMFDDFEDTNSKYTKWTETRGTWTYASSDNPFQNSKYNQKMVQCLNAPAVSRMISRNNISLTNYTIEVDSKGMHTQSGNNVAYTFLGFFGNPQYYGYTTRHPDAYYSLDLGGRVNSGSNHALHISGGEVSWRSSSNYNDRQYLIISRTEPVKTVTGIPSGIPSEISYVTRPQVTSSSSNTPQKNIWYRTKVQIVGNTVSGKYVTNANYILQNEPNWMITTTVNSNNQYGSYFAIGTSRGGTNTQNIYFDNFRVRKYAAIEPTSKVYPLSKTIGLNYISPKRSDGTKYTLSTDYSIYYEEADGYPSIIDRLAGKDVKTWNLGYGIKLMGY